MFGKTKSIKMPINGATPQALSSHHYRTTKLASKVLSRDQIGKAPSDVEAATIIAPAATAHCFNVSGPVPLVHLV
jgi:hypothetical protein